MMTFPWSPVLSGVLAVFLGGPAATSPARNAPRSLSSGRPLITSVTPTNAYEVTTVQILGSQFDASTTVAIDGVPEPVLSQTPTTLTIQPGLHAPGFADLTVTNAFGSQTIFDLLQFLPTLRAGGGGGPGGAGDGYPSTASRIACRSC